METVLLIHDGVSSGKFSSVSVDQLVVLGTVLGLELLDLQVVQLLVSGEFGEASLSLSLTDNVLVVLEVLLLEVS